MLSVFRNVFLHPLNRGRPLQTLCRVMWWKANQLFFNVPALVKISDEYQIVCTPRNSLGSYIVYSKWPEFDQMNFIAQYLRRNDVYIDVGAHIGPELLVAASRVTNGKLYGFEPTPTIFIELLTNLKLNNLEQKILVFPNAVSDRNGFARFTLESESEINHLAYSVSKKKSIKVKTVRLDSFVTRRKLKRVNVLKIDTEGAEMKVLMGATKLLTRKLIDVILFEVGEHLVNYRSNQTKLIHFLEQHHYSVHTFNQGSLDRITADTFHFTKTTNLVAFLPTASVMNRIKQIY